MRPAQLLSGWSRPDSLASQVRAWLGARRYRLAAALASVLLAVLLFTSGGQDDTYITYWPARALAEHGRLVNYNGDHLEQSSSLSLVVLLAALYKVLPLAMPTVGYLTGLALGAVTLMLGAGLAHRVGVRAPSLVMLAMGTVFSFAYWSTSGMESTLVTAASLWVVTEIERLRDEEPAGRWRLPLACLAFVGARPESPVVLLGAVAALAIATGWARLRRAEPLLPPWALLRVVVTAGVAVALLLLFRKLYFHSWVPNPATMKAPGFNGKEGLAYAWDGFLLNGPHLLALLLLGVGLATVETLRARLRHPAVLLVASLAAAQTGFAVLSGGDWMTGARFLATAMPAVVLSAFLSLASLVSERAAVASLASVVTIANLFGSLQFLHHTGGAEGRPLWTTRGLGKALTARVGANSFAPVELGNKLHLRDAVTIQKLLPIVDQVVAKKGSPIYVLTGQAGMMGYHLMSRYYGRAKLLDLWSLTSRELYNCFPPGSLQGSKWGTFMSLDGAFSLLEREGARCGAQPPDIYYNECLSADARQILKRHGYMVLYNQVGTVRNSLHDELYPGQTGACGHIAVRKEYVDALNLKAEPDWSWDIVSR